MGGIDQLLVSLVLLFHFYIFSGREKVWHLLLQAAQPSSHMHHPMIFKDGYMNPNTPPMGHATLLALEPLPFHTGNHANTKVSPYQFPHCLRTKLSMFQFSYGWDWSTFGELGVVVSFLHLFWQGKGVTPTSPSCTTIKSYAPSNDFQRWIHEP